MRNNRGITLTSLIIYIIAMAISIGVIATITTFFYKNINVADIKSDETTQYTKFTSIFSEEINTENNYIVDCNTKINNDTKESYIVFATGNQYTFKGENNSIYKNKIKICENIVDCDFSYSLVDSKYLIKVNFKTNSIDLTGDNEVTYILK